MSQVQIHADLWNFLSRTDLAYFRMRQHGLTLNAYWGVYLEGKTLPYEIKSKHGFIAGGVTHFTTNALTFDDLVDKMIMRENVARMDKPEDQDKEILDGTGEAEIERMGWCGPGPDPSAVL